MTRTDQESAGPPVQDLRGASVPVPTGAQEGRKAFDEFVQPFLARFGVNCELLETYTAAKQCDNLEIAGKRYIQLDHALLDSFRLLDWVGGKSGKPSFTAAALQRLFAEAARVGQHGQLYLFFIRRGLEVAPLMVPLQHTERATFDPFWQALLILCHEGAHALAPDHDMREALEDYARLSASSMMNEMIAGLSGELNDLLGDEPVSSTLREVMESWSIIRDDLQIGHDTIFVSLEAVATDPRFLDEIACDRFAILGIEAALDQCRPSMRAEEFDSFATDVLITAYRGFLHLRVLKYLDDVFKELPANLAAERIDPLKQHQMIEVGFRGNLVVRLILEAARDLRGELAAEALRADLEAIQGDHTQKLLDVANQILELTVLNPDFHQNLRIMLVTDGVDPAVFDEDPLAAFEEADHLWESPVFRGRQ